MIVKFFNQFWRMEIMTFQVKIVSLSSVVHLLFLPKLNTSNWLGDGGCGLSQPLTQISG